MVATKRRLSKTPLEVASILRTVHYADQPRSRTTGLSYVRRDQPKLILLEAVGLALHAGVGLFPQWASDDCWATLVARSCGPALGHAKCSSDLTVMRQEPRIS